MSGPCSEPDGNEPVLVEALGASHTCTAHEAMIEATGQCPWCGQEEDTDER